MEKKRRRERINTTPMTKEEVKVAKEKMKQERLKEEMELEERKNTIEIDLT